MFARKVSALLKPNSVSQFAKLMEVRGASLAAKAKRISGFNHSGRPDGNEVATISFWDQPASAEAYSTRAIQKCWKFWKDFGRVSLC